MFQGLEQPDVLVLLAAAAACCPQLRSFTLGGQLKTEAPQPASAFLDVPRLTALTSLALHNTVAPPADMLHALTQLRRLSLVRSAEAEAGPGDFGYLGEETPLRLGGLTRLDSLQVSVMSPRDTDVNLV